MDLLLAGCDPSRVGLCFDAGWAVRAGLDLLVFARTRAEWIGTLHLRDFRGAASVPLGAGDLDLRGTVPELLALPRLRAALVEQDPGGETPEAEMAQSRRFLCDLLEV